MRGQRPLSDPERLLGHRQHQEVRKVRQRPSRRMPPAPADLGKEAATLWRRLWKSRVSAEWDVDSDRPAVERYVRMVERWLTFDGLVRRAPMVQGSMGQLRPNPLTVQVIALEGQVRALEEQLGLTPASRVRLGVRVLDEEPTPLQLLLARKAAPTPSPAEESA